MRFSIRVPLGNNLNTTIFVRLPTRADPKLQGFIDPELQDWIAMFGYPYLTTGEQMEALKKKRSIFKKAGDKMNYFFLTERGRRVKDLKERIRRDWVAITKFAEDSGYENGMKEGKKEGLEEGKKEGLEEGKKEGLEEGKKEGLKEGLKEGKADSFTMIVKTRFPEEYVKNYDDWNAVLSSKSISELNDLINASINCASFQEIASRL